MKFESYIIQTPLCGYLFDVKAGMITEQPTLDSVYIPRKKNPTKTIKLTHPNGGETFIIGTDSIITWKGISPMDTVSLEYSTDSGKIWRTITQKQPDSLSLGIYTGTGEYKMLGAGESVTPNPTRLKFTQLLSAPKSMSPALL